MALRIAVNGELDAIESLLSQLPDLAKPCATAALISFHSLEDRIVKEFIRDQSKDCSCPPEQPICTCDIRPNLRAVTRKIVRPSDSEITRNPRSRSARLRVAQKLAGGRV